MLIVFEEVPTITHLITISEGNLYVHLMIYIDTLHIVTEISVRSLRFLKDFWQLLNVNKENCSNTHNLNPIGGGDEGHDVGLASSQRRWWPPAPRRPR